MKKVFVSADRLPHMLLVVVLFFVHKAKSHDATRKCCTPSEIIVILTTL